MPIYNITRVDRQELQIPVPPDALTMSPVEIVLSDEPEKDFASYLDDELAAVKQAVDNFRKQIGGIEHRHEVSSFRDLKTDQNILRIVFYHNPQK